jgi:hypothetical protein
MKLIKLLSAIGAVGIVTLVWSQRAVGVETPKCSTTADTCGDFCIESQEYDSHGEPLALSKRWYGCTEVTSRAHGGGYDIVPGDWLCGKGIYGKEEYGDSGCDHDMESPDDQCGDAGADPFCEEGNNEDA